MTGRTPRIEIAVEDFVLRGVPAEQAAAVTAAFEAHLADLARDGRAVLASAPGGAVHSTGARLGDVAVDQPYELGRRTAESVWRSITVTGAGEP